jgi:hypothetical protein
MVPLSHGTAPAPKSGAGDEATLQVVALATAAETLTGPPAAGTFAGFAVKAEMTGAGVKGETTGAGGFAVGAAVVVADMAAAPLDVASAPVPTPARASGIAKKTNQCSTLTMDPPG